MRTRWLLVFPIVLVLALVAVACSGEEEPFPDVIRIEERNVTPAIASSELLVGRNRFVLGLLDRDNRPIVDANVHMRFYDLNGDQAVARFDVQGVSRVPARDSGIEEQIVHIHADGTRHVHLNVSDEVGVYTAWVEFDRPGVWGVEISVESKDGSIKEVVRPRFTVLPAGQTPAVGQPAPASRQRLLSDVEHIEEIDSSAKPELAFHQMTIADAIASGRPALVLFAVPGFCESRFCGPEYEIMKKLLPRYQDRMEFIHVEFYKNPGTPERVVAEPIREWNLRTEPWFFLIDASGRVAAKFEGPTALQELEEAILALR